MSKSWEQKSIEQMVAEAQARMFGTTQPAQTNPLFGLGLQTNFGGQSPFGFQANPGIQPYNNQSKDESREVTRKYNSGFDMVRTLEDSSLKLYTQVNDNILSHLLSQVPTAFKGGNTLTDLPSEIKNLPGLYQERDSVFNEINALRNYISTKGNEIRTCTQLAKADQLASEMQTQYDQRVVNINSHITKAAEDMTGKIKKYLGISQEPVAKDIPVPTIDIEAELKKRVAELEQKVKILELEKKVQELEKKNAELETQNKNSQQTDFTSALETNHHEENKTGLAGEDSQEYPS
jgi:hypothetical protein